MGKCVKCGMPYVTDCHLTLCINGRLESREICETCLKEILYWVDDIKPTTKK